MVKLFSVDASRAGAGNLEIIVSVNGENVPNFVQAEGNARFQVSFTPQSPENHNVTVRFNNEQVQGKSTNQNAVFTIAEQCNQSPCSIFVPGVEGIFELFSSFVLCYVYNHVVFSISDVQCATYV